MFETRTEPLTNTSQARYRLGQFARFLGWPHINVQMADQKMITADGGRVWRGAGVVAFWGAGEKTSIGGSNRQFYT